MPRPPDALRLLWALCLLALLGCNAPIVAPPLVGEASTPARATDATAALNTLPPTDSGWQSLADGLERRSVRILDGEGNWIDTLLMLRIDPGFYRFDVAYSPGAPRTLAEWLQISGADIVFNGGYFTAEQTATGLVISNGVTSGWSYTSGGMLAIVDGYPTLRPLATQPYQSGERLDAALQAFPMLVLPDGSSGVSSDNGRPARRTVLGQDAAGRMLVIVANRSTFTLTALSDWLRASDLALVAALNLDGGTSSGLIVRQPREEVPAFVPLPTVVTVQRRTDR